MLVLGPFLRSSPYEIQTDRHPTRRKRTTLLGRLKRIVAMSSWRRTQNDTSEPPQETRYYIDDYDCDDIPLLSSNEPDLAFQAERTSSSATSDLNLSETGAFDCVGEESAKVLRTVQRALIATRADEA